MVLRGVAVSPEEVRREAKKQAGLMLHGNLNHWEPDDLIKELGQDVVDEIVDEMISIANRLLRQAQGKR